MLHLLLLLLVLSGLEARHEGWHDVLLGLASPACPTSITHQIHINTLHPAHMTPLAALHAPELKLLQSM